MYNKFISQEVSVYMKVVKKVLTYFLVFLLSFQSVAYATLESQFIQNHQIVGENEELVRVLVEIDARADRQSVLNQIMQLQNTEVRRNFNLSFNGFSLTVPSKWITKISQIKGVKRVTRANTYQLSTVNSKQLTQAIEASEHYGNDGEGMVISIIDSGVDASHKDMSTLKNPDKAKLAVSPESSEFNIKVPYGFNFADNSYHFKDMPGKSEHGMHVAGIAAASGSYDEQNAAGSVEGVASQAQILAMKVFTNNPNITSAYDDDIIAAIEKSVEMQADVINMSLGSANGFVDPEDPVQKAIDYAESKGVLVVVAAGNDATAVTEDDGTPMAENMLGSDRKDIGLVGGPATSNGALAVASFENSAILQNVATVKNGAESLQTFPFTADQGETDGQSYPLVYVNYGREEDYIGKDVVNKIVLVKRGEITFTTKVNNAYYEGAKAIVIFNNRSGSVNMDLTGAKVMLTTFLSQEKGEELVQLLDQYPDLSLELSNHKQYFENVDQQNMSSFTSWGTTNTLDFKPEITSVGGEIYSTVNDNQYAYKSGTSMAAPHVSGAGAIILSQLKQDLSGIDNYAQFVKKTMLNTTSVIVSPEGIPYTPRRQGAGLLQVEDAIKNRVLATFETATGEAVGELRDFTGTKTFQVVLTNYSDKSLTFTVNPGAVQTTHTVDSGNLDDSGYPVFVISEAASAATIHSTVQEVTIEAHGQQTVSFTVDATAVQQEFVEGFIKFVSKDAQQPSLTFAYLGFAGDWNEEAIFEPIDSQEALNVGGKFYGYTRLLTRLGEVVVPAGISMNAPAGTKYSYENTAISPNGDTAADVILPQFPLLRNVSKLEFNILDANGNVVRILSGEQNRKKTYVKQYIANIKAKEQFIVPAYLAAEWDGTLYNASTGMFETAADGMYTYQVKAYLRNQDTPQELRFKVAVDTKSPTVQIHSVQQSKDGVVIEFDVSDQSVLTYVYARINTDGDQITAQQQANGRYKVIVPNTAIQQSLVELVVKDAAYNETITVVEDAKTARYLSGSQSKVVEYPNAFANLTLSLVDSSVQTVKVTYRSLLDETIEVSKEGTVANGQVVIDVSLPTEGKYTTDVEELDATGNVVSKQRLDDVVVDYTPPVVENVVADKNGKVTATISDNIFPANELLVYINGVQQDAEIYNNTLTLQVAGFKTGDVLEVAQNNGKGKGLSTKVVLDYMVEASSLPVIPPPPPLPPTFDFNKKLVLSYETFVVAGTQAIKNAENPYGTVEEIDGKYFYTVKGTTNDIWTSVYVNGEEATIDYAQGLFSAKVEIKEGINTIRVSASDYTNTLLHEGGIKVFFDKTFATIDWNNHLNFVVEGDQTYLVVEEGTTSVSLSGIVSDVGFGYMLKINGDYVTSNSEIGKKDVYSAAFVKTISIKEGDIISVSLEDATQNSQEFKIRVKYKPVYPDLDIQSSVKTSQHQPLTIDDVVDSIPTGYAVSFVEDVSQLTPGTHTLHVKVVYPDGSEKIITVQAVIEATKPISITAQGIVVSATEKEIPSGTQLLVSVTEEQGEKEVTDTYAIRTSNKLDGDVLISIPINKKNFKEAYRVNDSGEKEKIDGTVEQDKFVFKASQLGTIQLVYEAVQVNVDSLPTVSQGTVSGTLSPSSQPSSQQGSSSSAVENTGTQASEEESSSTAEQSSAQEGTTTSATATGKRTTTSQSSATDSSKETLVSQEKPDMLYLWIASGVLCLLLVWWIVLKRNRRKDK